MYRGIGSYTFRIMLIVVFLLLLVPWSYPGDDALAFTNLVCTAATPDTGEETVTVYGQICQAPRVLFGGTDGNLTELGVLASDPTNVTAALPTTGWSPSTTNKIIVKCGWFQKCEIGVTFPPALYRKFVEKSNSTTSPLQADVECDEGDVATGGGGQVINGDLMQSVPTEAGVVNANPTAPDGWRAIGRGSAAPFTVRAWVVCRDASGPELP